MGRQDEIIAERMKKIREMRKEGLNPYPNKYEASHFAGQLHMAHEALKNEAHSKDKVRVSGRLLNVRDMGKIAFATLYDGTGTIQIVVQEKETPDKVCEFFKKYIDGGDFVGVEGTVFRTKRGELSILVRKLELLTKSILPLPDKFHGISDDDERLRKRYLEIITNPETREMFRRKALFWSTMRTFLQERAFLEVETPVLENSAGGASATPFATHHNALDLDVYLRISMGELWQKKLMVAGYPKTFEIGRQFRNEGMDAEHLQDYSQMEFYWAYANYEDGMKLVEEMYKTIAKAVYGKTKFNYGGFEFDLGKKWGVIDYSDTIKNELKIDIFSASKQEIEKKLRELKQEFAPNLERGRLMDLLWKVCRKKISGPAFLTGQPVEVSPLAKRNPKDPRKVEQFQIILAGTEMGNGYSELNDPFDQEERFAEQRKMKEAGDAEAQEHDESFVEALKYGMPPTCGFGVSERLFSLLENKPIRECVIFPLMRPTQISGENKEDSSKTGENGMLRDARHPELPREIPAGKKVTKKEALALLHEYVKSESLQNHCRAVGAAMRAYAHKFKADAEMWEACGLLHDFDYEKYPQKHTIAGTEILIERKFPKEIIHAILSHYSSLTGVPRMTNMEKALFAVDELSGLIMAMSKVRPDGFASMDASSVEKAMKKKEFAKGVNREDIEQGIREMGVDRKEHFELVIRALKEEFGKK